MAPKIPVDGKSTALVVVSQSSKSTSPSDSESEREKERVRANSTDDKPDGHGDADAGVDFNADTEEPRVRKHHTRSRVGCLTCRKRHVRCDGNQPTCAKCAHGGRTCNFPSPDPPLRERRGCYYLPGEHKPWSIVPNKLQPVLPKRVWCFDRLDPFDCLPICLPKRSAELLAYYHHIHDSHDISSKANDKDVLPYLIQNPASIRNTLLISGIHKIWTSGDTKTYQATLLHHKIETIQQVHKQLQSVQSKEYTTLIKHVATLTVVECALGNMGSAETHLDCLVAILDYYNPMDKGSNEVSFEEEMAYRYLSLAYNVVQNVKSRMAESPELHELINGSNSTDFPAFYDMMTKLHAQDLGCLRIQLQAASMYPFFFANLPSTTKFHDIDDSVGIGCLRSLTELFESSKSNPTVDNPEWGWVEGSLAIIHLAVMNTHVESLFNTTEGAPADPISGQKLISSWGGVSVAHCFYLHCVLATWNANAPINRYLLRLIMKVYIRQQRQPSQRANMYRAPDLWFWQHFVTAYYLDQHQRTSHDPTLVNSELYFDSAICDWSRTFGIKNWDQAQKRLTKIAWPMNHPPEFPKQLWTRALQHYGGSPSVSSGGGLSRGMMCDFLCDDMDN